MSYIPPYAPSEHEFRRQVAGLNPTLAKLNGVIGLDGQATTSSAQVAIDSLPDIGGVIVLNGDWSGIDAASLTVPVNKAVTWIVGKDGSLPEGMPGAVITRGYRAQPHESTTGAGARAGSAIVRYLATNYTPDPDTANQQDSVIYVEGAVPEVDMPLSNEFAAFRFNMSSKAFQTGNDQPTLDVKGLQGVVVSDGGGAKARCLRTTSIGLNGSTGIITGGMFSAHRSGLIPTQSPWNGNGTDVWASGDAGPYLTGDAAIIGQVGPGIQAVIRAEGFAGQERPQYGFLQASGTLGLLPELAVFQLHGGGNGDLFRILEDESAGAAEIAVWENTGVLAVPALRSNVSTVSLADNGTTTIPLAKTSGFISVYQENTSTAYAMFFFRAVSGSNVAASIATGAGAVIGTGAFPADDGTTKADFYISGGNLVIRNRLGATVNFSYTVL